jgi:hypothetical protein
MVNLVNELASQGMIFEKNGKWEIQKAVGISIPESLREIEQNSPIEREERRVLEAASVKGESLRRLRQRR